MKVKTSELIGPALDWAVAKCEGGTCKPTRCFDCPHYEERRGRDDAIQYCHHPEMNFEDGSTALRTWASDYETHERCPISELTPAPYSTDWSQGGPIIERFSENETTFCLFFNPYKDCPDHGNTRPWSAEYRGTRFTAETPLAAAMRCYCASKLGDEVEIPEELP